MPTHEPDERHVQELAEGLRRTLADPNLSDDQLAELAGAALGDEAATDDEAEPPPAPKPAA